jgi:hypothetical protein
MKMIPINSDDMIDANSVEPGTKSSPFKRGLFIGVFLVAAFWILVVILAAALLVFH